MTDGRKRNEIQIGQRVRIVEKQNQKSGTLTEGDVARVLTSSPHHPHGIKVQLKQGAIERVKAIVDSSESATTNNDHN